MPIQEIIDVQITRDTRTVSQAGFGTLLILGTHKEFNERLKFYSNLTEVAEDFDSSTLEYIASRDTFAQSPRPTRLAIGRRTADNAEIKVETAMEPFSYTVTINGTDFTLSDSTPTVQESTVELDADLVTSNDIDVSVNGSALTTIPFDTDHITTMNNIAAAIQSEPNIASVVVTGDNDRILQVTSDPNEAGIIDSFVVTNGASQANATITNELQDVSPETIADSLVTLINADVSLDVTASLNTPNDGTINLVADSSGTPYTLETSTSIVNPNRAKVTVTQAVPNREYKVVIQGIEVTYVSPVDIEDNETVAAALVTAINDSVFGGTVTDNLDGSFFIDDSTPFSLTVTEQILSAEFGMLVEPLVASDTVENDLDAIALENNEWYALAYVDRTQSVVESIANWIESREKIFGTASDDSNIIDQAVGTDTTSIAAFLNQSNFSRSFAMYHQDADSDFPECAWFGRCLPTVPGSITWKFKSLNSIAYSDLSTTESKNARDKKANTFEYIGGVGITRDGTMGSGDFIDIIRGVDWLTARIQEFVYALLVNSDKVPYTNAGIASVESEVRRALDLAVDNDFIADNPPYTISVPLAENVSSVDKANRILRDVDFQATLAGAVHLVVIRGRVTV